MIAVDLGLSVDVARRTLASRDRIAFVQADVQDLPLAASSIDWSYSLGVLHHMDDPARAVERIRDVTREGGGCLLYLYYALDGRGRAYRSLFRVVDRVRRLTSALPRPMTVGFATLVALTVYWPLARLSASLARAGASTLADRLPLSFYRDRSFRTMRNDSLDRLGTSVEHSYTRRALSQLLMDAGWSEVTVSKGAPYWHAWAT